jgi:hypothetical protein
MFRLFRPHVWKIVAEGMDGGFHYTSNAVTQIATREEAVLRMSTMRQGANPFGYEILRVVPQHIGLRR